jgi:hypothetical protein
VSFINRSTSTMPCRCGSRSCSTVAPTLRRASSSDGMPSTRMLCAIAVTPSNAWSFGAGCLKAAAGSAGLKAAAGSAGLKAAAGSAGSKAAAGSGGLKAAAGSGCSLCLSAASGVSNLLAWMHGESGSAARCHVCVREALSCVYWGRKKRGKEKGGGRKRRGKEKEGRKRRKGGSFCSVIIIISASSTGASCSSSGGGGGSMMWDDRLRRHGGGRAAAAAVAESVRRKEERHLCSPQSLSPCLSCALRAYLRAGSEAKTNRGRRGGGARILLAR